MESRERRQAARVDTPGGEAFCHVDGQGDRYIMTDLSTRGARLRSGPMVPAGKDVEIVIFAGGMGMVSVTGKIVRQLEDGFSMAVSFDELDRDTGRQLEDLVATALIHDFWPTRWLENGLP